VMALGGLMALTPSRRRAAAPVARTSPVGLAAEPTR
jgi:hypothetical protein